MRKKTYSVLLLIVITYSVLAKPSSTNPLIETQHYTVHRSTDLDTAESPDEFLRPPLREHK